MFLNDIQCRLRLLEASETTKVQETELHAVVALLSWPFAISRKCCLNSMCLRSIYAVVPVVCTYAINKTWLRNIWSTKSSLRTTCSTVGSSTAQSAQRGSWPRIEPHWSQQMQIDLNDPDSDKAQKNCRCERNVAIIVFLIFTLARIFGQKNVY